MALILGTRVPQETVALNFMPSEITGTFNQVCSPTANGSLRVYNSSNPTVPIATYTQGDIVMTGTGNVFSIAAFSGTIQLAGTYFIKMSTGLFVTAGGEFSAPITNTTAWAFTVPIGDWDKKDWDNEDWLI